MIENLETLINKVENLSAETKALWGNMTAQHMIEHLIIVFKTSNGKLRTKCMNPPEKWPVMKKILASDRAFPKNFVNPIAGANLRPLKFDSLEIAISKLRKELEDFKTYFVENPGSTPMNATFGELNFEEWIQFHIKHVTHHYSQFSLIES